MNRNQFAILVVLVVALGAAGLYLYKRNQSSWQSAGGSVGQKLLPDLQVNDVAAITIKGGTNETTVARVDNRWRVKERANYPANYGTISSFLLKAADLKAAQVEEVGPSMLPRYGLLPPGEGTNTATLVELKDASGKTLKSLLLGKQHMRKSGRPSPFGDGDDAGYPDGRYLKVGIDAKTVALVSDTLSQLEPKPDQWLDKEFFKVEKAKTLTVTHAEPTNSFKLLRETEGGEWKLADARPGESLDSGKIGGLSMPLSGPSFTDVLGPDTAPASVGLDKPTVVALETFEGLSYTVNVGTKTNDTYPVTLTVSGAFTRERTAPADEKPEDKERLDKEFQEKLKKLDEKLAAEKAFEKWTFLVSSWNVDQVIKNRHELMAGKKDEAKPEGADHSDHEAHDDVPPIGSEPK